jgi:hypothetical protein
MMRFLHTLATPDGQATVFLHKPTGVPHKYMLSTARTMLKLVGKLKKVTSAINP